MRALPLVAAAMMLMSGAAGARAQTKHFSGFYAGAEAGRQSLIGGSLVGGVDVLAQEDRGVAHLLGGVRYQFAVGFVVGAEASYGLVDGDLRLSDPGASLEIDYRSDRQRTLGLIGGVAVGPAKRWLVFVYAAEATRVFDVTIRQGTATSFQSDEQGMLRFGGGVEARAVGPLHLRASAGTGRADFGDRQTNIEPERRLEMAVGLVVQF